MNPTDPAYLSPERLDELRRSPVVGRFFGPDGLLVHVRGGAGEGEGAAGGSQGGAGGQESGAGGAGGSQGGAGGQEGGAGGAGGSQGGAGGQEGGAGSGSQGGAGGQEGAGGGDGGGGGDHGFPANTPIAQMTAEQQAAYWKFHAQKHERQSKDNHAEVERLRREQMSDSDRRIAEARDQGKAEGRAELVPSLVRTEIRSQVAGRLDDAALGVLLEGLDHTKYLDAAGDVDTAKVKALVEGIAGIGPGKGRGFPDLGQGRRGSSNATPSVASGRDLYGEHHKRKSRD
jgi:hypothetical protein